MTGVVQAAVLIIVTRLALNANWGARPLLLGGIVLSLCIFAAAFGGIMLAITRDIQKAQGLISVVVLGSMILSGGVFQLGSGSPVFRAFQQLLPHYHGQRAMFAMIYGGDPGAIGTAFTYFLGGAAILFVATVILTRRSS